MIKFFRTFRKDQIKQSRPFRYLLYAIGEIILVVIGILIALQINNWNETRKEKAYEELVYQQIYDDLANDCLGYKIAIDRFKVKDSLINDVLYDRVPPIAYDTITKQNQKNFPYGINLILNYANLYNRTKGYELYKTIANPSLEDNKLSNMIEEYYTAVYRKEHEHHVYINNLLNNMNIVQQKEWYLDYELNRKLNPSYIDYIQSDAFKTRLWDYHTLFIKLFARDLKELHQLAETLKQKIKNRLKK